MTIHSRLPPLFLLVWRVPDPVHNYCSSWRLIDLATALETTTSDWVRPLLHIQDLFLFFGLEMRSRPHSVSCAGLLSVKHRALWAGTIRNKMFVLLPSPGSFSELHLSPIKAAPAKLFSAVKSPWKLLCPTSNPIQSSEIESALSPPLSINVVLVKWVNEWMPVSREATHKTNRQRGKWMEIICWHYLL